MASEDKQGPGVTNPKGFNRHLPLGFRPSDFMRARRPELFSDSRVDREPKLSPAAFEHHLASLTSRKQEADFEYFCRLLAEKELCPNLLPQTGPTGGGDSKVDSETYPVADEVSLRWYEGLATRGESREPWAFAFSAKQGWRSKVHSDVAKIAKTGRGYKLIYFITNQFVRDKARAEVESSLKKRYRVPIHILDRSWIKKCIFEHDRVRLAIDGLHLTGYEADQKVRGPRDAERELELKRLEEEIRDPERYQGVEYQLAEECLHAALLARGLELPRVEVEGRFLRAEQIASRLGHHQQQLRIAYARAWTVFWWFDDFEELASLYEQVEKFAVGSGQVDDLELLLNIWRLLSASVGRHGVDARSAKLGPRTATLRAEFQRLASDARRPNNALWARTSLLLMELPESAADPEVVSRILSELKVVVAQAEGLISYPTEALAKLVEELGDALGTNPQYDQLFEALADVMRRRVGEGEAGRMLLARGHQKLRGGNPYDAIRLYGRAQQVLAKREYRLELIAALVGGCLAYESAGLLWAARANVLGAANQAFSEYYEEGQILPQALTCLRKLAWLELQLGRVPAVLQWIEAASLVAQHLALTDKRKQTYLDERATQDAVLGILLLKADIPTLQSLSFLPAVLQRLGLDLSFMALLYALGYEDHLRRDGLIPATETPESLRELCAKWIEQPATKDLPGKPEFAFGNAVVLRSSVLGCEVTARAENNFDSVCLAERILGALEALLAKPRTRFPLHSAVHNRSQPVRACATRP